MSTADPDPARAGGSLPLLVFDGRCRFCTWAVRWLCRRFTRPVRTLAWQRADLESLRLTPAQARRFVWWFGADGSRRRGHLAVAAALAACRRPWPRIGRLLERRAVTPFAALGYRLVSLARRGLPGIEPACAGRRPRHRSLCGAGSGVPTSRRAHEVGHGACGPTSAEPAATPGVAFGGYEAPGSVSMQGDHSMAQKQTKQKIRDVMTPSPVTLSADQNVVDAARHMREQDIGAVLVRRDDELCGIVTDRDIVVRAVADGKAPADTRLVDLCTSELATAAPEDDVQQVIDLMREKAIRRIPVIEAGKPVGIVSLGDLATSRDEKSVLAAISAAPAN